MNPIIPIVLEFAIKYGIPATLEIIKLFQKTEITVADWEAVFKLAQTPYGLTPNPPTPQP